MSTVSGVAGTYFSLPTLMPSSAACKKIALCAVALAALSELPSADAVVLPMAVAIPSGAMLLQSFFFAAATNPVALFVVGSGAVILWAANKAAPPPGGPSLSESARGLRRLGMGPEEIFRTHDNGMGGAL